MTTVITAVQTRADFVENDPMTLTRALARPVLLALAVVAAANPLGAQKFPAPPGWKWVTDAPVGIVETLSPPEGSFLFGTMAPGWHITTRPGVTLFEPSYVAKGRFALDAESFLFPGTSQEGFGVFAGGRDLDGSMASYTAFLIRRDGSAAVARREAGTTTLVRDWTRHAAIKPHPGGNADAGNVLRVEAEADIISFLVNGTKVLEVPRLAAPVDGVVGLRIGADIDVHVTNLDLTSRLALPRPVRKQP
jgi:hypothetical protein